MKVVKFGGSSMADAGQYRKIRDILLADPERQVVVVSAAGKRYGGDHKLTDLLYLCYSHVKYGVDCSLIFDMIKSRYLGIQNALGLDIDLEQYHRLMDYDKNFVEHPYNEETFGEPIAFWYDKWQGGGSWLLREFLKDATQPADEELKEKLLG